MLRNSTDGYRPAVLLAGLVLAGCAGRGPGQPVPEAAEQAFPAAALSRYDRALGLMDAGADDPAADELRALAASYPDYSGPLVNLAIIRTRQGDRTEAMRLLELAVTVCQACAPAWNQMGILHRQAGEFEAAGAAYREALDADPGYALAHYNLGLLYDLYQSRPDLALEQYERYLGLTDDDEAAAEVRAWVADLRRRLAAAPQGGAGGAS